MKPLFRLLILTLVGATLPLAAAAQQVQTPALTDDQAYCLYVTEQAKAQSDLLRTPTAIGAFTQPETGLPTQLIAGASLSVSSLKKAGITLDAARKNCDVYKASIGVQQSLQFSLAGLEKEALTHRLTLIDTAAKTLQDLIDTTTQRVDAQDMTRTMLWGLQTNKIKLDADHADTQSKIAAIYLPTLNPTALKAQVAAKQSSDAAEQSAQDRLSRQNNWDVELTVGAHQQINPVANNVEPYGQVTLTYNLATHAIDKHLDQAAGAYGAWKNVQEGDAVRGMEVLRAQVIENITAQQNRLTALQQETAQLAKNLQLLGDSDTSAALDFRNQLTATQLLLDIETGDATFRRDRLQNFLKSNF